MDAALLAEQCLRILESLKSGGVVDARKLQVETRLLANELDGAIEFLDNEKAVGIQRAETSDGTGVLHFSQARILDKGREMHKELSRQQTGQVAQRLSTADFNSKVGAMEKLIFVSHKESDAEIAAVLVDYLLAATRIADENLLCSSVPGHQLDFGRSIAQQLKDGVRESAVLVALLSPACLKMSSWVLFELGAAWGSDKLIIPILGPGLSIDDLPGPLKESRTIRIEDEQVAPALTCAVNNICTTLSLHVSPSEKVQMKQRTFIETFRNWRPVSESPAYDPRGI